jgi:signal transduction histidine kinase
MRRRTALATLLVVGVAALLVSFVWYTQRVAHALRLETERSNRITAIVLASINDPTEGAPTVALIEINRIITEAGLPQIMTDSAGNVVLYGNLPDDIAQDTAKVRAYVRVLDAENPSIPVAIGSNVVHYGTNPLIRRLSIIPAVQAVSLAVLLIIGALLFRTYGRAERDRTWAGMARESAHQIGTPLSSLHGWMEVLRERAGDPLIEKALDSMGADVDRLERVAHRFERIGRPPKRDQLDVAALIERVVQYFRGRVPTLTTPVHFVVDVHGDALTVPGDRVLLEWALDSLIKNAVDALAGVGGTIKVHAETLAGGRVRMRVEDDGPGVPAALRSRIFEAGFSTKERGWGIGLALTRRIVEENHGGKLALAPTTKGAAFDIILPA